MLGGLEQKIMDTLWSSTLPLKPSQIVKTLNNSHAYTTITTVLKRMFDKKLVRRRQKGNVFYYSPVMDKSSYACECLDDLFERLFDSYGSEVSSAYDRVLTLQKKSR
jgi:predicted transcriptional regulator